MDIRPIAKSDYKGYTTLTNSSISLDSYMDFINNVLSRDHHIYTVTDHGSVVGTGTLLIERKMTYGGCRMGHIENIMVSESHRNGGIGQSIVEKLIEVARSNECYRIDLNCNSELEHFYNKCGLSKKTICMNMYIKDNFN